MPHVAPGLLAGVLAGLIHAFWNTGVTGAGGNARFFLSSSRWVGLRWAPVGLRAGWTVVPRW